MSLLYAEPAPAVFAVFAGNYQWQADLPRRNPRFREAERPTEQQLSNRCARRTGISCNESNIFL
jgi:hypothetical protein